MRLPLLLRMQFIRDVSPTHCHINSYMPLRLRAMWSARVDNCHLSVALGAFYPKAL